MNAKLKLIVFTACLGLASCKHNEQPFDDYKFSEKGIVLNCDNLDTKLYNEALFAFENDVMTFYGKDNPNQVRAYSQFVRSAVNNRVKYTDMLSPHTVKVFEALKKDNSLWDVNNPNSHLNYNSPFFKCIGDHIQNKDLKTTLNALVSTNSMSPKLFGTPLMSMYSLAIRDKYLAAYVAFDLFYAKLFDVDLTQVNMEKPAAAVDFNKIPN
ncbi:hypothetical protein [Aestuariivivens sediminicola]|uniref:hypothetical protein n=1 Tax=Aestuariivivens sediminicola TaxID=2913560 RepID=UPI001F56E6D0|nr:hypothetical protein [Aestuariivivens sediminicola]